MVTPHGADMGLISPLRWFESIWHHQKITVDLLLRLRYSYCNKSKEVEMIHSGTISYLNSVHRKYGVWKYNMLTLKRWSDGKMTVMFERIEDEQQRSNSSD